MKLWSLPRWITALGAVMLVSLLAVSTYAQIQSGNIFGKVQAKDGSVLPGVTVTLTGVGAPQTTVTDETGQFRFINLSPGTYALKAELSGFGTATRQGVSVNLGRNADVAMTLNAAASESITVTAEAPLLDIRKTGTGADIAKVELEQVPTARDPWVILQQTPGVTMDRNNVGGNESGQQSVYVSKGTTGIQSTWNVDGVNITDFAATGSSPAYYDFDAFEEMQITTGGTDPRIQTAGVQLNMVTKRGTNDFKGSARAFHTSSSYQSTPQIPSEAKTYLARVNQINKIDDDGAELGGPIWRDKLWFWGAYGKQKIDINTASLLTSGARFQDITSLKNENAKINAQPLSSNSLTLVDQYGAKVKLGRNVSTARFPETGWNQNNTYAHGTGSLTDPTLWKIEDTQLLGKNLYLTGLYSKVQGGFRLIADNGKGCTDFACGIDSLPAYRDKRLASAGGDGAWHRSYESINSFRPQKQYRIDGSAFANTGSISHELKFGYGYRKADVTSQSAWPGGEYVYNYGAGRAGSNPLDTGVAIFPRLPLLTFSDKSQDMYVGDTVMVGNLTLQAGLRYDNQQGSNSPGIAPANPVVPSVLPAETFAGASGLKWTNLSPRLGLTYSLGSDRRTLLRAAYSRYVDTIAAADVTPATPGATAYAYYYFNDLNNDNIAQPNELEPHPFGFSGFDPTNPTVAVQTTRWANGLHAPHTDEFILGGEREVMSNLSFGINATYRKLNDFVGRVGEFHQGQGDYYTSADYVLHAPASATLPNGQVVSLPYYVLAPGIAAPTYYVLRNVPGYSQEYKGLELTATKRMANRWMLRGNLTLQDWTQRASAAAIVDPTVQRIPSPVGGPLTPLVGSPSACYVCSGDVAFQSTGSGSKGGVYINSKWAASITGVYQIPVIETSFGFNLNSRQGYATPYVYNVNTSEGPKSLLAESKLDSTRNGTVTELDLRLAKEIRISRVGLTLSVDGFNILDQNTVLQRNVSSGLAATVASGTIQNAGKVTEVLSPRVFRIGARLSF